MIVGIVCDFILFPMIFLKEIHFYSARILFLGALHHCFLELENGDLSRRAFLFILTFILGRIAVYQGLTQFDLSKCNVPREFECTRNAEHFY